MDKKMSGLRALLIALPFALLLAWWMPTGKPSRTELAQALGRAGQGAIAPDEIESIACDRPAASGYACRWRQQVRGLWEERSGRLSVDAGGWRLVQPAR